MLTSETNGIMSMMLGLPGHEGEGGRAELLAGDRPKCVTVVPEEPAALVAVPDTMGLAPDEDVPAITMADGPPRAARP